MTDDRSAEDDRKASEADKEIDRFSIAVLGYNRRHPEPGQPSPGSTLRRAEEAMASREIRKKRNEKIFYWVLGGAGSAIVAAFSPWIMKKLGLN